MPRSPALTSQTLIALGLERLAELLLELGQLTEAPPLDPATLAEQVFEAFCDNGYGDLNRKNILLTASGYQLVDIEPLVCVPLASGSVYLRTTRPYLARADREKGSVTVMSDRLGWNCFSAWIREAIARPALAASQFEPQRQWSADCCASR